MSRAFEAVGNSGCETAPSTPPMPVRTRALLAAGTWGLTLLAQPGLLSPDGAGWLGFIALAPWALAVTAPGPRPLRVLWAVSALGLIGWFAWMRYLLPWLLPVMGAVPALWILLGARVTRALAAGGWPLALACPAGWMVGEVLRFCLPEPLSFGWWRLGVLLHDLEPLNGSARVWGTWGLSWVLAASGGWCADLIRGGGRASRASWAFGLGPLLGGLVLGLATAPPGMRPGPRVLLVTPGLEQSLKAFSADRLQTHFVDPVALTQEGLAEAGDDLPDLICWGETMLPARVVAPEALEASRQGAQRPAWAGAPWSPQDLEGAEAFTSALVEGVLFGRPTRVPTSLGLALAARKAPFAADVEAGRAVLPGGASLLTGVEEVVLHDGQLRRRNAAALWTPGGERAAVVAKTCLVPAAEDPAGFTELPFLLDALLAVGGYVPDFVPGKAQGVVAFPTRGGEPARTAVVVCYDNVFDGPFASPLAREEVDFFTVLSNEAWYEDSVEMDHMVAFSRLAALSSGRAVARATNSGASVVLGPDGRLLAELAPGGRRRMARGTLVCRIPIPEAPRALTPWVRTAGLQPWLWLLPGLLGALAVRRRSRLAPA